MPISTQIDCPECGKSLVRKPGGRCPECGADVRAHVVAERERETRIEKVVAIISTILVVSLAVFAGGCNVVEGVLAYAAAGALIWYWGRRTFTV
jgi:hypothetical protein